MNQANELPKGINFAWYLMIWLTQLGGTEHDFWHSMTPYRVIMLYKAKLKSMCQNSMLESETGKESRTRSLYQYMKGGK